MWSSGITRRTEVAMRSNTSRSSSVSEAVSAISERTLEMESSGLEGGFVAVSMVEGSMPDPWRRIGDLRALVRSASVRFGSLVRTE
jgi:hypothetical protein